jgi:hypothetical protein
VWQKQQVHPLFGVLCLVLLISLTGRSSATHIHTYTHILALHLLSSLFSLLSHEQLSSYYYYFSLSPDCWRLCVVFVSLCVYWFFCVSCVACSLSLSRLSV